jgi:hypothetical protein
VVELSGSFVLSYKPSESSLIQAEKRLQAAERGFSRTGYAAKVIVGGAIADSAPTPEPCVRLSPHVALQSTGHCHWHRWMTRTCLAKSVYRYVCGHGCPQTYSWAACFIAVAFVVECDPAS